jgi:hypothetical protein
MIGNPSERDVSDATQLACALTAIAPDDHFFERRLISPTGYVAQVFRDLGTLRTDPVVWDSEVFPRSLDGSGDVYFSVATRTTAAGSATAVGCGLAVWADIDDEDAVHAFPIAPSAVVQTSPPQDKFHAYWFLGTPTDDLKLLVRINRAIPNADLNATDKARVLRAPGFVNLKYDSRPTATLLRLDADRRYSIDELAKAFPPVAAELKRYTRAYGILPPTWLTLVYDAIVDSLERDGFRPRQRGTDGAVMALCPLHEDTNQSLSLHPTRGFYCFGCQTGGRLTDLAHRLGVKVAA